jgi:hypothetical protein
VDECTAGPAGPVHNLLSQDLIVLAVVRFFIADNCHGTGPPSPDANDLVAFSQGANRDGANGRVEAGDIATPGENPDHAFFGVDVSHTNISFWLIEPSKVPERKGHPTAFL